jgi:hypothetical protein
MAKNGVFMAIISSVAAQAAALKLTQTTQAADNSVFESLLGSFGATTKSNSSSFSLMDFSSSLIDMITGFAGTGFSDAVDFPFSPSFTSTFGNSGPLPVFIATVTAKLNLSTTQQIALQDIAVSNKDIVKSPESVQKVAMQLQAAGIGHA